MERTFEHSEVLRISEHALGTVPSPEGEAVGLNFISHGHPGMPLGNRVVIRLSPEELADLHEQISEFMQDNQGMFPDRGTNWTPFSEGGRQ